MFMALVLPCVSSPAFTKTSSTIPVDVFEMENKIFGNRTLYISKDTIKVEITRDKVVIMSKAPYTEVVMFNNDSHTIYIGKVKQSIDDIRMIGDILSDSNGIKINWKPTGKEDLQGVPCNSYRADIIREDDRSGKPNKGDWRKYWTRRDVSTPVAQTDFISAACGVPVIPGVPQRLENFGPESDFNVSFFARSNIDTKKKVLRVLMSTKSYKRKNLPAAVFAIPKNYARKMDIKKVLLPGNSIRSLKDMKMSPDFLFETK
jgi:hypothetical protein